MNNTCQYAMVLYAADPNVAATPTVIITLGSIAYFFSILEILANGFLVSESHLAKAEKRKKENQLAP